MRRIKAQAMQVIGITGGVGAGKSAILNILQEQYNARVIQADKVGHLVMEPGREAYEKVLLAFGTRILCPDGRINREILGQIVFADQEKREELNHIIHPTVKSWIYQEIQRESREGSYGLLVIEAALLIEDHYEELCEEFWYIYTDEKVRRERLKRSRGYTDEKITAIFESQLSETAFREHCQVVIDNNGSLEDTYGQIQKAIWRRITSAQNNLQTGE